MAQLPERSLLEAGRLPFGDLVRFAAREGRRPRPIYQIHKWFARRLGCAFRALLLGAVEEETAAFWKAYYRTGSLAGLTMLDPFVGGGTSVVEATRLGASTIGVDVDPIACQVTLAELAAKELPDLAPTLLALEEAVGKVMAPYYATQDVDGRKLIALHYFWVQMVKCDSCETVGEAHPNFVLGQDVDGTIWGFCRHCHEVHRLRESQKSFTCRRCDKRTVLDHAPVREGVFTCSRCKRAVPLIAVGRKACAPPSWSLFAIEACERVRGPVVPMAERVFLRATARDKRTFERARAALIKHKSVGGVTLPDAAFSRARRSDNRLTDYGYRRWTDLFGARQLLHLGLLSREIARLPEGVRRPLCLAFSNHLTTNCMMTAYATSWRRLTPLFGIRAYRHVPRPVELNPWGSGTGRGSFPNAVRQVSRAAAFARFPKEPARRGGFVSVPAVRPADPPRVLPGNARDLRGIPDGSIDIVLTDPPYFDNLAYSELSEFFQPWLEQLRVVPSGATRRRLVRGALKAHRGDEDSLRGFARELGEAFAETRRVLKINGMLAFTFRHSTADAWRAMAAALRDSGLRPVQVLPIPGEAGAGLHAHDGTSLWDAVLVFRKQRPSATSESLSARQVAAARKTAQRWRERFRKQDHIPFNDADYANLFRAALVTASLGLFGADADCSITLADALGAVSR